MTGRLAHPLQVVKEHERHVRRASAFTTPQPCAIVTTIGHDKIAEARKSPENDANKYSPPRFSRKSFCALWTTTAQDPRDQTSTRSNRTFPSTLRAKYASTVSPPP